MNDQLPDFEPPAPMFEDPKPKKDRKPRRKVRKAVVEIKGTDKRLRVNRKKRRVVKAKVIRRGRPAGSKNKPKQIIHVSMDQLAVSGRSAPAPAAFTTDVYRVIGSLMALDKATLAKVLGLFR